MRTIEGVLAIGVVLLASCGGSAEETTTMDTTDTTDTTGGTATADPDVIPTPPTPWDEMSMDDKRAWMAHEVLPRMAASFEGHDGARFGGFNCESCHGPTAEERNWEMPNPDIMTLYATGSQEQAEMVENHRPMVTFMFQEVVPTMQTLLGAEPYDDATGEGFSCYTCHPSGGDGTPAQ